MKGRAYQWDADNRLVKISPKAGNSGATTTLQYDGVGRFTKITTTNGGTVNERRFLWCGDELCQSRTASDSVQEHFYEEGIHTLIAGHESTYAIKDHLGSVHKNIGINSQSVYASFYYNPYGWFYRSSQTGTNLDEFRYAGMFYLPEAELYFTRYRAYDPSTGRWLSRDPIAEQGGINLYGYVGGNPVNRVDPLGEFAFALPFAAAGAEVLVDAATAVLGGAMIADSINSRDVNWDDVQKDIDHANYHRTCDRPPPPGLSPCELAKWEYRQAKSCYNKRQDWENSWGNSSTKERHDNQLAEVKQRMANAARRIAALCKENCN